MFNSRMFALVACLVMLGVHATAQNDTNATVASPQNDTNGTVASPQNDTNATVASPPSEITAHDAIPGNEDDVEVGYDLNNFDSNVCRGNLCDMASSADKYACFAFFHTQVNTEHVTSCVDAMCTNSTWPEPCYDYDGTEIYEFSASSLGDALKRTYVAAKLGLSASSFSSSSSSLMVVAALAAGAIAAVTAITTLKNKMSPTFLSSSFMSAADEKSALLPGRKKKTTAVTSFTSNSARAGATAAAACVLATVAIVGFSSGGAAGPSPHHLGVAPRAAAAAAAAPRAAAAISSLPSTAVRVEEHEGLIAPRAPAGAVLVDSERPALGWKLPKGPPKNVTFLLHTKCVSNETKKWNPNFWEHKITNAYIAHKSAGGVSADAMFSSDNLLEMTPVTEEMTGYEFGWERGRFVLTTNKVDFEWGFVLKNELGELYYEIGSGGMKHPIDNRFKQRRPIAIKYLKMLREKKGDGGRYAKKQCPDVVQFGSFFNRLANEEPNGTVFKQPVDALGEYVFGQCDQTCEKVPFPLWDKEDREYESNRTQHFPPTGLGEGFTMYGEAGRGVPILWAFGDWPATPNLGKVLFVFNARDRYKTVVFNTRVSSTNPHNWGPEEYSSWVFGPTGDRSSEFRWRLDFTNMETYYLIEFCSKWIGKDSCTVYKQYFYREPKAYELIKHIDIGSPNSIPYLIPDWSCDFYRRMDQDISRVPANVKAGDKIDWGIP